MTVFNILILPGDGVGREVVAEAVKILRVVEAHSGVQFELTRELVGSASYEKYNVPITREVMDMALQADAVLFGSEDVTPPTKCTAKREVALLQLRKELNVYANLRPCQFYSKWLLKLSVLKAAIAEGTEFITGVEQPSSYLSVNHADGKLSPRALWACVLWAQSRI